MNRDTRAFFSINLFKFYVSVQANEFYRTSEIHYIVMYQKNALTSLSLIYLWWEQWICPSTLDLLLFYSTLSANGYFQIWLSPFSVRLIIFVIDTQLIFLEKLINLSREIE